MDAGIPEYVLDYARSLELPDPSGQLKLWLQDGESANRRRRFRFAARAPYYLLACAAEDETVCLNAGYVLERAAMLLGAHGVAAKVLLRVPEGLEELPGGRRAVAALAFGMEAYGGGLPGRGAQQVEHPFICREAGEAWTREVLAYGGAVLAPEQQTGVRLVRGESAIHIAAGRFFGRNAEVSRFHGGMALAAVMGAAEELWIDLCMVRLSAELQENAAGPDYLISVCRREDRRLLEQGSQKSAAAARKETPQPLGGQWRYA